VARNGLLRIRGGAVKTNALLALIRHSLGLGYPEFHHDMEHIGAYDTRRESKKVCDSAFHAIFWTLTGTVIQCSTCRYFIWGRRGWWGRRSQYPPQSAHREHKVWLPSHSERLTFREIRTAEIRRCRNEGPGMHNGGLDWR
jgi:hypothetical protein